ncbi:MAG: TetR/AcrR family transcriptional regulator, partial [Brevundimonas sp.]
MPRVAGQIDTRKREAILDAAAALFAEKGPAASMDEIARRAGVSKQTLYNRFASRVELGRALAGRRSDLITEPLRHAGDAEDVLTAFAAALLAKVCTGEKGATLRAVAMMSGESPDLARAIYDAGPMESLRRLADWLETQNRAGRLHAPDPMAAAEMFAGMTLGHAHLRHMMAVPHPEMDVDERARDTARRNLRAVSLARSSTSISGWG